MPIKKLLLVSCSTGAGHFRAAEALRLTARKLYPETQVLHIDLADYLSGPAKIIGISSYNPLTHTLPKFYKFIYYFSDIALTQKFLYLIKPILRLGAKKFLKKVEDYAPDHIVSTHFFTPLVLPDRSAAPLDMVITDYHVHRIWLAPNIRNFFVASEDTKKELANLGIKSVAAGIPIYPSFSETKDISALKIKLGINNNLPTVLILPISRGQINAKQAVDAIFSRNKNINVVAISGRDPAPDSFWESMQGKQHNYSAQGRKFIILKHADNIDEWMRVADIIVSKAGGLTITEAIYLQKPLIIVNPIPGQEDYNTAYLEKNRLGLNANSENDLANKIQMILANHDKTKTLYQSTLHQSKLGAGQELGTGQESRQNAGEIILKNIFAENV